MWDGSELHFVLGRGDVKRVMKLSVCRDDLRCVLLLFTVDLFLSLFPLMSEWGKEMANEYENGMK